MSTIDQIKDYRGLENICRGCGGAGKRGYGSTATWHGGMGGQTCTVDICDKCWGSGDDQKPWLDLRKLESIIETQVQERILTYLTGIANMAGLKPALDELIKELEKLGRGRKARPQYFYNICQLLAKRLMLK
jgi:hypothetical protein